VDHSNGYSLNRQTKNAPYAYTWYLTSITGPDFVDRNGDGMADDGDWGYWVDFEYGKWSNNTIWRNPSEGYNEDEDNEWQNCSVGYKEVYYLNAIRTRSHVALFEKDIRADARGESSNALVHGSPTPNYTYPGAFDNSSATSMQLSHIYLLNASDENYVPTTAGTYSASMFDASDVNAVGRSNLEAKAIRVIDFNYDYSLCQGTSNSFTTAGQLSGKLSLRSVSTRGKGGVSSLPPIKFQYELSSGSSVQATATVTGASGGNPANFTSTNSGFNIGDMINGMGLYCGVITAKSSPVGGVITYTLANCNYTGAAAAGQTINTTKNPPYNKDAYDAWGMYKGDINAALLISDLNLARTTSSASAPGTDAWSLRGITTQLGSQINVNYETNSYYNSSAEPNQPSLVIDMISINQSNNTMTLTVDKNGNNAILLSDSYQPGDLLNALLMQQFHPGNGDPLWQTQNGSNSIGNMMTDTRTNTITFSDDEDNENPQQNTLGFGHNLGYYSSQAVTGQFIVQSTNDVNNTVVVQCTDPLLIGTAGKVIQTQRQNGSSFVNQNQTIYLSSLTGYGGNLFIKNKVPLFGGGVRVNSLSITEQLSGTVRSTNYGYNDVNTGLSSGISSYTPSMGEPCFDFPSQYISGYAFYPNPEMTIVLDKQLYYKTYRRVLYNNNNSLFALARELPSPGVMYKYVTVTKQIKNPDEATARNIDGISKTQYQFEVFQGNMVGRVQTSAIQTGNTTSPVYAQSARYYALDKFIGCIGNLKSTIQYDNNGNKLTETDNHYLHDNLINTDQDVASFMRDYKLLLQQYTQQYKYQGFIQERYSELKLVSNQPNASDNGMKATLFAKEELPCISTGQTYINYVNGTQTSSKNLAYDFYSGAITQTLETDAYGNNVMTESVPAYTLTPYSSLGLKVLFSGNKNMLTQIAETRTWKVDASNNKTALISANATAWSDQVAALDKDATSHIQDGRTEQVGGSTLRNGDIWRPQYTYKWMPTISTTDGLTPAANFTDFTFSTPLSNSAPWQKTIEHTLFDVNSKLLESKDINANYSAMRMGYNNSKIVLTATSANYYEIAYSGAEDEGISETNNAFVKAGNGSIIPTNVAHTGKQSLFLPPGPTPKGFVYTVPTANLTQGRDYIAQVWACSASSSPGALSNAQLYYTCNGVTVTSDMTKNNVKMDGNWSLISLNIPHSAIVQGVGINLEVGCINNDPNHVPTYLDDFRFHPINAATTAYVYDTFSGELTYIISNSNLYTRYEYDAVGRLVRTYKEKLNVGEIKATEYQYNMAGCQYQNFAVSNVYTKNNCSSGSVGSMMYYTVPAGQYCSNISPTDASNQAQNDLTANGQQYVNNRGACFIGGVIQVSAPTVNNQNPAEVVAFDPPTGAFRGNFICLNGTSYINLPVGSYNLQVFQFDNVNRNITLTGFTPQVGSNVTFNNVTIGFSQLSITMQ